MINMSTNIPPNPPFSKGREESKIRVRIAPSPTGRLHVGLARAALFNYLFAKRYGGTFILRIEDTDIERSNKQYEKDIFEGLRWLGIESDESPEIGGPYAPYRQSERIDTYAKYTKQLLDEGNAFYCFHSEKETDEEIKKLIEAKKPALHLCEYRTMGREEAELLTDAKQDYIIRFKTPVGRTVEFHDLVRGKLRMQSGLLGDFSIAKRVDVPLYNFAVVVDDATMQISHVIRGEDHIANTPKQILLNEALGFRQPQFAHLPLILGPDRSKLSKRHGVTSVNDYKEMGYLPEALFNFLALLGWSSEDSREILSRDDLVEQFSLERVQKSGAVFDLIKLDWMNGEYIRQKSASELTKLCMPFLEKAGLVATESGKRKAERERIEKIITLEQPRLKKLSEIGETVDYFFKEPEYDKELLRWKKMSDDEIIESIDISITLLQEHSKKGIDETEKLFLEEAAKRGDRGKLFWPLRAALTGKKASPGPFEVMEILGIEESIKRLELAKQKLG